MATITSKWFAKWRGAAVSLALSGNSIGQFVLIPLFTLYVANYGWRATYLAISLIMLVINTTVALLVMKGDPEKLGRRPFGGEAKTENARIDESLRTDLPDLGLLEAMRTRSFWLFLIVMFVCGSGDFLITTHLIPLVTDHGISPAIGGHMLAWLGLMSLAGILVAGPASDLIGNKIPIALTFLLRFFLFVLILRYQSLVSFYFFAVGFGFTLLITAPLNATLMGKLYGYTHLGILTGFVTTVHHLGGGFWAYVGGVVFDHTGSYRLAFVLSAIMALVAVICTIVIIERKHPVVSNEIRMI
jgi:MFS family permease